MTTTGPTGPTAPAPRAAASKEQLGRLLALVPYLHARGAVRLDRAADDLGVPPRQLVRDLKVLLMCGLPGGYPDDLIDVDLDALEGPQADGVIRVSNADYLARPLRLTPTEASAVVVALRALRGGADAETRAIVDRTLAKIDAAVEEGADAVRVGVVEADADALERRIDELAARLEAAATEHRQVRLSYFVPARDEVTERAVDPRGVVTAEGHRYLDAWCHVADAPRLFRLDRIRSAEVTDVPVLREPEPPRDLGEGLFATPQATIPVTLRLQPDAAWVVEYYPVQDVRELGEGVLEVVLPVADPRWLTRLLLRLTPAAEVVSPAGLGDEHRAAVRAAAALYGAAVPSETSPGVVD